MYNPSISTCSFALTYLSSEAESQVGLHYEFWVLVS